MEILSVIIVLNQGSTGRYKLAERLGISKARARLLLDLLNQHQLIVSRPGRAGTILSQNGVKLIKKLNSIIFVDIDKSDIKIPDLEFESASYVLMIISNSIKTTGIFERDLAVRAGADGAVTLIREDKWVIPPDRNVEMIVHGISVNNPYNMIIYAFGDPSKTRCAAMTIACHHIGEELLCILDEFLTSEIIIG